MDEGTAPPMTAERLVPVFAVRLLAVALVAAAVGVPLYVIRARTASRAPETKRRVLRPKMVVVPAGTYTVGSPIGEKDRDDDEAQRVVSLSRFAIAETEVTQAQYAGVIGKNPSKNTACGPDCPVENVTWNQAALYCNGLSAKEGLRSCYRIAGDDVTWPSSPTCDGFRLPTEVEWEVAARGGSDDPWGRDDPAKSVCLFGNVLDRAGVRKNPEWKKFASFTCSDGVAELGRVKQDRFLPNGFGLFGTTGNVFEWVWDWYTESPKGGADPRGPNGGHDRVIRGGGFNSGPAGARVAYRDWFAPSSRYRILGFRVARSLP